MSNQIKVITMKSAAEVGALQILFPKSRVSEHVLALGEEQFPVLTFGEVSSDAFVESLGSGLLAFGQNRYVVHVVDTAMRRSCGLTVFWKQYLVRDATIVLLEPTVVTVLKPEGYREYDLEYPYEAVLLEKAEQVVVRYTFDGTEWPVPLHASNCISYW